MLLEEAKCLMMKALKKLHDDEKVLLWNLYQDTIDGEQKIHKVNVQDLMSMDYWQSTMGDDLYQRNWDTGEKELDLTAVVERYAQLFIRPDGEVLGTGAASKWMILEYNNYGIMVAKPLYGNEDDEYLNDSEKKKVRYIDDVIDNDALCRAILTEQIDLSDVYMTPEVDTTDRRNQESVNLDNIPELQKLLYMYEEQEDESESEIL